MTSLSSGSSSRDDVDSDGMEFSETVCSVEFIDDDDESNSSPTHFIMTSSSTSTSPSLQTSSVAEFGSHRRTVGM